MHTIIYFAAVFALPLIAHAQTEDGGESSSLLSRLFFSFLPFLILAGVLFWFLRRVQSGPRAKQTELYMVRHQQHMESVERSLERIASALERKGKDAA
jgi:ATP-dependent Zn protease